MDAVLDWMNSPAATLLGAPVSWIEIIGFVTGAACVYAVARQKLWNWPVGIVNNVAFMVLFFGAGLYGETLLQAVFAAVSVYGWYNWVRGAQNAAGKGDLPIRDGSRTEVVWGLGAVALATVGVAMILTHGTDSQVPWPDAFVLAASLLATYWQARKIFQHWYVWIVIDLVSIPLYFSRGLNLTAILYIGFTALCIYGLVGWMRTRLAAGTQRGQTQEVPA
ncbi:nicotinamide riboside transporter PnuC [Arthrobacter gengyunqii]|uniref:Nicotinamide riboside transporter PnuC n=1 Tax=Arthrobacter gengyunqii TaxID=2886940 RepID=A0A9X1M492_9MICC|nr:nicotinamide riboside transporter PnuC [Arthrobacter gengyunqii]MCC3270766.1 nicotinamide riboside transporter PnuC [Arthrobacter gengyunqii]UOY96622.1 nicotinamide riboside transporter PnuC [Arthrobacter gengyunqii]